MGSEDAARAQERAERKRKERSASAEVGRERKRDKKDKKERRSKDKKDKKDRRDKSQKQQEGRDRHDEADAKAAAQLKAKLMMPVEDGEIDAEDGELAEAGSVRAECHGCAPTQGPCGCSRRASAIVMGTIFPYGKLPLRSDSTQFRR